MRQTKVLVVEDDKRLARLLELELKHAGYESRCECDGTQGLRSVRFWEPDLILLDRMLPGMDGVEVCRNVRLFSSVPILMLTAKGETVDKVEGLDSGADDYITKPFQMEELLARMRAALRGNDSPGQTPLLVVQNLTLDPFKHTVCRDDTEIELTKREFDLLEYMMRNRSIVLTRGQILDHVWGETYEGEANIVDVYIRYLRGKMDDAFEPKLLHTVRGVGYVLDKKNTDS
ncbi:response regulator transcription factor [Ethanoligenens harbinense]|uniref:Stage 0 sporulation protein A homolog n=1 Tax=Ethanoligenens harbinense (strain DSM 18485 / JCM 12961 / CGMCC 1.5033 / YUAN-3) TaxID=663278 RepID=E6U4P7_ETHHY|nr:response regulator transcription factor [Ethanoligenens harbinense]ADU26675.1 two component transcriptional regulator, winged helix family [Ethanoligenens harbinense YUAN-3]AVQ95792.1 DNA-binding response regulator [Ethanoligenens harbinense YUAN-3]AYF38454.1 DNA-binding response regulator [Ethanoligenens harbinense]AYF41199.1 DNA-binding response regulator [Ethanoligenens harbinense]QCN92032.1 DNA-binding response regulator [Ethanoligenens harbinense]